MKKKRDIGKLSRRHGDKAAKACSAHYWEYLNRMRTVADNIRGLGLTSPRVLDVGGATGNNLLKRFGIENVVTLDINEGADIVASAHSMPLKDQSFEVVTCIDTLEHIPVELRLDAIREMVRTASSALFIVAPADSEQNVRAEKLVLEYVDNAFLKEHQEHGLVDFGEIRGEITRLTEKYAIERVTEASIDNLLSWVVMMTYGKVELSEFYGEAHFLENGYFPRRLVLSVYLKDA